VSETAQPVVLIVEDDEDLADFYGKWLADTYDVRTAYDGEQGLDLYDEDVDIVLLDRRMPGMSGDTVLERIRKTPYDAQVVMVTAITPEFDIVDMAFDDYLVKPVSSEELYETIEELLTLTTYDRRIKKYHALSTKRTMLEASKPSDAIAESDEYDVLMEELADLQDEFEELREELDYDQLQNAFRVIDFRASSGDQPDLEEE
jgi:two-component system response regulator AdeR